ncbi:MAG: TPM domain-containing protein [Deltaproteobacteria bacterium]|nr:TPM domain-containing protein [Deltaproteobacteria bacterium]
MIRKYDKIPIAKFALFAMFLLLLVFSENCMAGYPEHYNDYVDDYADIIEEPDAAAITRMFENLESQTGIEAVAVTMESYRDYDTGDETFEEFATGLFNDWGIGHKKENNGVLILVSVKDRKCRIELGEAYGSRYDSVMKEIIDTNMLPYFKSDDYTRGIFEGCRAVVGKITHKVSWFSHYKWHILIVILIIICITAGISCMKSGKKGWGWMFFAGAGILLLFLLRLSSKNKSSSGGGGGFGGGSSSGGGASGSW